MIAISKHADLAKIQTKHVELTNFRQNHIDLIKLSVFILPQSVFCISTTTVCLPSQIWILFEIHIYMLDVSTLVSFPQSLSVIHLNITRHQTITIIYIIEIVKYNNIQWVLLSYSSLFYAPLIPPPWKNGLPLVLMVKKAVPQKKNDWPTYSRRSPNDLLISVYFWLNTAVVSSSSSSTHHLYFPPSSSYELSLSLSLLHVIVIYRNWHLFRMQKKK